MIRTVVTALSSALETIECQTGRQFDLTIDLPHDEWYLAYLECVGDPRVGSMSTSEFTMNLASGTLTVRGVR